MIDVMTVYNKNFRTVFQSREEVTKNRCTKCDFS